MHTITRAWIYAHCEGGRCSTEQLYVLGVIPPLHGWMRMVIGERISDRQRRLFERLGRKHRQKKELSCRTSSS